MTKLLIFTAALPKSEMVNLMKLIQLEFHDFLFYLDFLYWSILILYNPSNKFFGSVHD